MRGPLNLVCGAFAFAFVLVSFDGQGKQRSWFLWGYKDLTWNFSDFALI